MFLEFTQESISAYIFKIAEKILRFSVLLFFATLLLYGLLFIMLGKYPRAETGITIFVLLASQLIFTAQNFVMYNNSISDVFGKNMSVQAKSLAEDFQKILDYNIRLEEIGGAGEYMNHRISENPQCANAYITDVNLIVLHQAYGRDNQNNDVLSLKRQDTDLTILPLTSSHGNGYLVLKVNRNLIFTTLRDMALDSATVILVTLIFSFILKDLILLLASASTLRLPPQKIMIEEADLPIRLIKVSTFLFMFAAFETLSFIPLLIQDIYNKTQFASTLFDKQTIISLPVASYMLGVVLAMFITLFMLKRLNIKTKYMLMTLFFILGSYFTIQAQSFWVLIIARLVAGFGFGGVLLATSSLVILYTDETKRSQGFGTNAAAFASASICSIPVGGMIVNKFGYQAGIWVSIGFAVSFLVFSVFCVSGKRDEPVDTVVEAKGMTVRTFFSILFSRHVLVYIVCINIPFQLIYVGLFQFLLPIYMSETLLLSQGNVGRILSVFGVVSLFAGYVSRLADRVKKDHLLIAFGALCVGITMILFKMYPGGGLLLFIAVMIAMGIDNVFIDAVEEVYIASGNIPNVSDENLLQSYKSIEKIISVVIPTITGLTMVKVGFDVSILLIGIWSVAGALLFILLGKNNRWRAN